MMGKSSAPKPPDPMKTAAAQTGTNISTAVANSYLNNANQVGPDGSITYSNNGYETVRDPSTGKSYQIPIRTATTQLSPQQQAIKAQTDAAQLNLGGLANQQSGFLKDYMAKPFELSNEATESRLMELGRSRLDPALDRRRESMESRLANQGVMLGSEGYDRAMSSLNEGENDAYNQLLLSGRGQAIQELLTERNQPINEISALLSGSQVSMPQAAGYNQANIATTDVGGLINANYAQQQANYQNKQAGLGGLFSGLGSLAGGMIGLSDDEAKKDKTRHGDVEDGMGLWSFRYKGEPKATPKHVGLMASEVEKKKPSAVKRGKDGYRRVDYGKALGLMGA